MRGIARQEYAIVAFGDQDPEDLRAPATRRVAVNRHRQHMRPNFPELAEFHHTEVVERAVALLGRVARGEIRPGPILDYPQVIIGPAVMAVIWLPLFGEVHPLDLARFFAAHLDLVFNGLPRADCRTPRRGFPPQLRNRPTAAFVNVLYRVCRIGSQLDIAGVGVPQKSINAYLLSQQDHP